MGVIFSFVSVSHGVLECHAVVSSMDVLARHGSCFGSSCYVVVSHVTFKFLFWLKMALLKHVITAPIVSLDLS